VHIDSKEFRMSDSRDPEPGSGTGDGGALGAPEEGGGLAPPSYDQEANSVVSGGGVVGPDDDDEPADAAG